MSILQKIVENTETNLVQKKGELSLEQIKTALDDLHLPRGRFKENISNKDEAIIAEIKKASPSAGVISEDFDPIKKAIEYEAFGASALSILTEEDFFMGSVSYLKDVKKITNLPILRKDFMIDEYQIYESKLIGADCILLIASILSDQQIKNFINISQQLELDYLIEVHDENELRRVEHFKDALIGVNNRNLKTFEVDLDNSVRLRNVFKQKNIFTVLLNGKDQLLVEDELMELENLREAAINFLDNGGGSGEDACDYCKGERDKKSSDNPDKAIISLKNERETSYATYISVQNELVAAYTHLRNVRAQELYGTSYSEMMKNYKDVNWPGSKDKLKENINRLRKEYPQKLSEVQ